MKKVYFIFIFISLSIIYIFNMYQYHNNHNEFEEKIVSSEDIDNDIRVSEMKNETTPNNEKNENEYFNLIKDSVRLSGTLKLTDDYIEKKNKIAIYHNYAIDINKDFLELMVDNLKNNGWNELDYDLMDEYSFILAGNVSDTIVLMNKEELIQQAEMYLKNSGLLHLFDEKKIEYEIIPSDYDELNEVFCYLLNNGERTGGYIRINFRSKNICEECQARLYESDVIENVNIVPLNLAMEHAFYIDENADIAVDSDDYDVHNIEIVYINGIPYYKFNGYSKEYRTALIGYALAINVDNISTNKEDIYRAINEFDIK